MRRRNGALGLSFGMVLDGMVGVGRTESLECWSERPVYSLAVVFPLSLAGRCPHGGMARATR